MRVAIWGSYNHGNYGDDVMAIMFALELKRLGVTPVVFRLTKDVAERYDVETVHNVHELLKNVTFTIIGGGAWLTAGRHPEKVENDCKDLMSALEAHRCPLYAISIGGDGGRSAADMSRERQQLFSNTLFMGGTVRLEVDVRLLAGIGKKVSFFPDVVLRAGDFFCKQGQSSSSKRRRIGVNLNKSQTKLIWLVHKGSRFFRGIEFVFIRSHKTELDPGFEYYALRVGCGENLQVVGYDEVEEFVLHLTELDLILSFKLHLGVTCLGGGVPFLSIGGSEKTRAFIRALSFQEKITNLCSVLYAALGLFNTTRESNMRRALISQNTRDGASEHLHYLSYIAKLHLREQHASR